MCWVGDFSTGEMGNFHPALTRARRSIRAGEYDSRYRVYPTSSPRRAFLKECRLYHQHDPIDNSIPSCGAAGNELALSTQGLRVVLARKN